MRYDHDLSGTRRRTAARGYARFQDRQGRPSQSAGLGKAGGSRSTFFKPSSDDEESPGQRRSIWVEGLTLPDQAWDFTGRDPEKAVVACLNVDDIRAVVPPEPFNELGVEWEQAQLQDGRANNHPGSEGHAGISGLLQGGNRKKDERLKNSGRG